MSIPINILIETVIRMTMAWTAMMTLCHRPLTEVEVTPHAARDHGHTIIPWTHRLCLYRDFPYLRLYRGPSSSTRSCRRR
ncbi:hypothetical protein H257_05555 [Aphanomyces astaci]|uniref:Uncharacterized protein n=1 Tax=Aphanomyces astaci TaxID=112090 RepID=W4GSN8_APHAT|nr:hypothetical protein H257_05555 [Aphanomyces astaci]ETV82029.1 hypothetical protein H257_05555 [Aphanomyces astaci]|eukprot:XP_009828766.1 hypothetical protein H257_05555 [Aphanomyces astaci]